jgi:CRP-like cAMP-binding protein
VVVLDGRVAVVGGYDGELLVTGVHGPRRFLGELGLLSGQGAVLAAVVLERGEVLVVPLERVRELLAPPPSPLSAHTPSRHDQRGMETSTWPPAGTCTWPPAGTFS